MAEWQKRADGKFIPVCEPSDIKKKLSDIDLKLVKLVLNDIPQGKGGSDLKPYWRCPERKYQ